MCLAGQDAAVSSFVIDAPEGSSGLVAALLCGDTGGNIRCFVDSRRDQSERPAERADAKENGSGARRSGTRLVAGVAPRLVLKRQHGNSQVLLCGL